VTDKADPFEPTRLAVASDGEQTRIPLGSAPARVASDSGGSPAAGPAPVWTGPGAPGGSGTPAPSRAAGGESLLQPGTLLNNTQRIEALIGRGGMGEVYRAVNVHTGDRDAIKVIRSDLATDPQVRELFRREAAALRKVRHPSVVSYEGVFGDDAGRVFLVMDFVDGPSLASLIAKGPLEPPDVRRVGVQVAEGLAACHERGVVHRDLSPDNVVLRGGSLDHAVLIDFGVAKRLDGGSTLIGSGFAGKLDYCSPEQCGLFDGGVDHRTDVYSLGLLLAAAAVGKPLPMGSSMARAVKARETQPDLSGAPEELRRDLSRLLEPDPARRPQSMREVAALLSYNAPPPPPPAPLRTVSPLWVVAWVGGGAAVVLLLVGLGVLIGPRVMAVLSAGTSPAEDTTPDQVQDPDEQRRVEEAARRKAEEEQREAEATRRTEEDARRQADERAAAERRVAEEAQRKAEADRRAAEEAQRRADAEARRREEEAQRKAQADKQAVEEAQRRADAERRRLDEEAQRKAEADRRAADEAQRKAEADRRAGDEAQRKAEADRRIAEEARRRADEEARRAEAERAAAEGRRAEEETRRRAAAEEARRRAEEERRAAAEAQRKADEERRRREAAQQPPPPPPQPQRQPPQPKVPPPVVLGTEGAWRGTICFRRLALTAGNETCGPLNLSIAGGTATGSWVVNGLTYGIHGAVGGDGGKVTLDMPPTGQGSSLGAKFTLAIRLNGAALQGEGYTINSVLVKFSAGR
jgi:serine/threonine-protein kinase